jgi:hypothetical protein
MLKGSPLSIGFGMIALAVALFLLVRFFSGGTPQTTVATLYFTSDDGATWFPADINQIPPFMRDGTPAVQAMLFSPDGSLAGAQVAYLLKYPDAVRDRFVQAIESGKGRASVDYGLKPTDVLVKRRGDAQWITKAQAQSSGFFKAISGRAVVPD